MNPFSPFRYIIAHPDTLITSTLEDARKRARALGGRFEVYRLEYIEAHGATPTPKKAGGT